MTHFKAGLESVLKRLHIARRTVGCQNDLLVLLIKSVEGVEEFLLSGGLSRDELNIVDQKNVAAAVLVAELVCHLRRKSLNELSCEILALYVDDLYVRLLFLDLVCDRVKKVGLSETARAVNKEGIVIHCGIRRNRRTSRVSEFI